MKIRCTLSRISRSTGQKVILATPFFLNEGEADAGVKALLDKYREPGTDGTDIEVTYSYFGGR